MGEEEGEGGIREEEEGEEKRERKREEKGEGEDVRLPSSSCCPRKASVLSPSSLSLFPSLFLHPALLP